MRVDEIERYLAKEMPYPEREAFEAEMAKDPALLLDVRLLACVMQKTRDVCRDFDKWAAQRLLRLIAKFIFNTNIIFIWHTIFC